MAVFFLKKPIQNLVLALFQCNKYSIVFDHFYTNLYKQFEPFFGGKAKQE